MMNLRLATASLLLFASPAFAASGNATKAEKVSCSASMKGCENCKHEHCGDHCNCAEKCDCGDDCHCSHKESQNQKK